MTEHLSMLCNTCWVWPYRVKAKACCWPNIIAEKQHRRVSSLELNATQVIKKHRAFDLILSDPEIVVHLSKFGTRFNLRNFSTRSFWGNTKVQTIEEIKSPKRVETWLVLLFECLLVQSDAIFRVHHSFLQSFHAFLQPGISCAKSCLFKRL